MYKVLHDVPKSVQLFPRMTSLSTIINNGYCATNNWENLFGLIENGKKAVFRTNRQIEPWIQLDLHSELQIIQVEYYVKIISISCFQGWF